MWSRLRHPITPLPLSSARGQGKSVSPALWPYQLPGKCCLLTQIYAGPPLPCGSSPGEPQPWLLPSSQVPSPWQRKDLPSPLFPLHMRSLTIRRPPSSPQLGPLFPQPHPSTPWQPSQEWHHRSSIPSPKGHSWDPWGLPSPHEPFALVQICCALPVRSTTSWGQVYFQEHVQCSHHL